MTLKEKPSVRKILTHLVIACFYAISLLVVSTVVSATPGGNWQESLRLNLQRQGTDATTNDFLNGNGVYVSGSGDWVRMAGTSGGAIIVVDNNYTVFDCVTMTVTTTAGSVTGSLPGGFTLSEIFNRDTAINVFCGDSACDQTSAGANGTLMEPRTGRAFPTSEAVCCASASGSVTVDVCGYVP